MTITEEVVRAAVSAHHGAILEGKSQVDALVALLFAVDPLITTQAKAEALKEAAEEMDLPGSTDGGEYSGYAESGYRESEGDAKYWLRARAATIEGKDS